MAKATAQKNIIIYHTSGTVNIIVNNKSIAAARGNKLARGNSLELKQNATCMLIEQSGRSLQVNAAGIYTFESLQQMLLKKDDNNVSSKFFKYVYENLFAPKSGDQLGVTPVVFRGEDLMKTPADNTIILADAFSLSWKNPVSKAPVRIAIQDDANRVLIDTIIKKSTSLQVYLSENKFIAGHVYSWKAEEAGSRQPTEHYFNFIIGEKKDAKKILSDLDLLHDKNISVKLKQQLQQDIFLKWKNVYAIKQNMY